MIHPQSVVHSFVEFLDGSYKAQLGLPDMRLPIQFALTYPERLSSPHAGGSPETWPALEFSAVDADRYPAYRVVRTAAEAGGNRGAVVNAADEIAVQAFLERRIRFTDIAAVLERAVDRYGDDLEPELDAILALDAEIRRAFGAELPV